MHSEQMPYQNPRGDALILKGMIWSDALRMMIYESGTWPVMTGHNQGLKGMVRNVSLVYLGVLEVCAGKSEFDQYTCLLLFRRQGPRISCNVM